eukprot:PhF_6_TR12944/c1_g1_i1/m.20425
MSILRNILLLLVAVIASTNATQIWVQYVGYALDISNSDLVTSTLSNPNPLTGSVAQCKAACTGTCNGFNYNTVTGVCTLTKGDWDNGEDASDWTYAYGVTFYGTSYPTPQSGPTTTTLTCTKSASQYYDEETSRQFSCPAGCATANANVYGTGQYRHHSSICRAAIHDGRITNAAGGTVTVYFVGPAPALVGSNANGVSSSPRGYSSKTFTFATYTPPPASCRDIHFWVPEGLKLEGNLQSPQVLNNNFDNRIYSGAPNAQAPAMFGCTSSIVFSNAVKS